MWKKMILTSVRCLILSAIIGLGAAAQAAVWYVDADAPAGGSGTSWESAFNDIQLAIDAGSEIWMLCMAPEDQIWVKSGVYHLSSTIDVYKPVHIYGGFPNSMANPTWEDRDWKTHSTIIDGGDGAFGSANCLSITQYALIDGFTIRDGYNAGIRIESEPVSCVLGYITPRIRNCTIRDNSGSGILDLNSSPKITNCEFINNTSWGAGAINSSNSTPIIEKCIFIGNEGGRGGAIQNVWGCGPDGCPERIIEPIKITNCLFYQNTSASDGGAILLWQVMGYTYITNCTFSENDAADTGGAIYAKDTMPIIQNSILWGDIPNEIDYYESGSPDVPCAFASNIQGGWDGENIDEDPLFVGGGDLHLTSESPCIDGGVNNAYPIGMPDEDLDGNPRPVDGDLDGIAVCDMGAYETGSLLPLSPVYRRFFQPIEPPRISPVPSLKVEPKTGIGKVVGFTKK